MKTVPTAIMDDVLDWCRSVVGAVTVLSDHSKTHGGHESATCRLQTTDGIAYVKVHQSPSHWRAETHAYEQWACAFGNAAPQLLAVGDTEPLALLVSEVPGRVVEDLPLPPTQERAIWRTAGTALAAFHEVAVGTRFGQCLRNGTVSEKGAQQATHAVSKRFMRQMEHAVQSGHLADEEITTLRAAYALMPAFADEPPIPCHRDYCAANWLINEDDEWVGVIDFEFSAWDVRVADFSRDPQWSWIGRPDLCEAFFEGYGWLSTPTEEQQLLIAHAEYALSAIVWGHEHAFYGFEREGRESLAHLTSFLR